MKTKLILLTAALGLAAVSGRAQTTTVLFEDFEDSTVTYTTNIAESSDGSEDYFGRVGTGGISIATAMNFTNLQGTGFFGAHDTDAAPTPGTEVILTFAGLNATGLTDFEFSGFFAEDDDGSSQDWDDDSSLLVEYQFDTNGFNDLFAISATGGTNTEPAVDTNFDGTGNGTIITDAFTEFSANLIGTGSTLDLRITIDNLTAGDEDIAFDNITITAIPEPSSIILIALTGLAAFGILRFRKK